MYPLPGAFFRELMHATLFLKAETPGIIQQTTKIDSLLRQLACFNKLLVTYIPSHIALEYEKYLLKRSMRSLRPIS